MRGRSILIGLTAAFLLGSALARAQAPPKLEFEVATVKPAAPLTGRVTPRGGPGTADPEHIHFTFLSMKNLLMSAYSLPINQVFGPAWIDSERYDIVGKVPAGATKEQVNVMLQNLLADRFKLKVHRENRELPIFELVAGKNGSKLKPYLEDPNAPKPEPGKVTFNKDGEPIPPPGGLMMTMAPGRRKVTASKQSIARLTEVLAADLGRPVVDKTGLAGEFDYTLEFRLEGPNAAPPGQAVPPSSDNDAPDLLTAVQEQLGLRLESKKGPVDVVVVDEGEKTPTEN